MAYDAKYNPLNLNYLKKEWGGTVTANDIAIQNNGYSLGQRIGETPEQLKQKEMEDWFRANGLDPNQYYGDQIEAQAPQPGFNPAGGKVNTGKPLGDGRTPEQRKAEKEQIAERNKWEKEHPAIPINRKAAAARAEEWRAQQRAIGAPGTTAPAVTAANWWQDNNYHPVIGNTAPAAPGMPMGAPASAPIESSPIAAPIQSSASLLPNYMNPMQMGQPNAQPTLPQQQQSFAAPRPVMQGLLTMPSQQRPQSFGNAAKLLQLPSYLRRRTY